MFLIFALLSSWNSQYYTWPLFASSFCGKHGLPKEVLFVSLLFLLHLFFLEVLAAIIYEQGGQTRENVDLEVSVRQKEGDWKEALLLLTPKLDGEHIYELGDIKR